MIDLKAIRAAAEAAIKKYGGYPVTDPAFVIALLDRLEAAEKALAEPVVKDCLTTEPAVEPVAFRSLLASGSYAYSNTADFFANAEALYTSPPPPAEVPLLSDAEVAKIRKRNQSHNRFAREIEKAVRQKVGLV